MQCKDIAFLRNHPTLKRLSYQKMTEPVDDFWKTYDARQMKAALKRATPKTQETPASSPAAKAAEKPAAATPQKPAEKAPEKTVVKEPEKPAGKVPERQPEGKQPEKPAEQHATDAAVKKAEN
jgi:hypothetical protein